MCPKGNSIEGDMDHQLDDMKPIAWHCRTSGKELSKNLPLYSNIVRKGDDQHQGIHI